jgi:hypothetical protein
MTMPDGYLTFIHVIDPKNQLVCHIYYKVDGPLSRVVPPLWRPCRVEIRICITCNMHILVYVIDGELPSLKSGFEVGYNATGSSSIILMNDTLLYL